MRNALFAFLSEMGSVGYTTFLIVLIGFIKNPEAEVWEGIGYLAIFATLMFLAAFFRNYYIADGFVIAIKVRKTLIAALYTKISKLSMKSLTETNSGKLVTIVSGDI